MISQQRIIFFDEVNHRYTDELGNTYKSATTLNEKYSPHTDFNAVAEACAKIGRNPKHKDYLKYKGETKESLLLKWKINTEEACFKGKTKHNFLENGINIFNNFDKKFRNTLRANQLYTVDMIMRKPSFGRIDITEFEKHGIAGRYPSIYKLIYQLHLMGFYFYAEIGVYSAKYLTCGCIDLLAFNPDTLDFFIVDWKTNAAPIRFEAGYFEKDINGKLTDNFILKDKDKYMLSPIANLEASTGNKYALQLSNYALHCCFYGLKHKTNLLCHIRDVETFGVTKEDVRILDMPDFKSEVNRIFEYDLEQSYKGQNVIQFQ